jgi:hypothetical protein
MRSFLVIGLKTLKKRTVRGWQHGEMRFFFRNRFDPGMELAPFTFQEASRSFSSRTSVKSQMFFHAQGISTHFPGVQPLG